MLGMFLCVCIYTINGKNNLFSKLKIHPCNFPRLITPLRKHNAFPVPWYSLCFPS